MENTTPTNVQIYVGACTCDVIDAKEHSSGGYAAYLYSVKFNKTRLLTGGVPREATMSDMLLQGLCAALCALKKPGLGLEIYSDNQEFLKTHPTVQTLVKPHRVEWLGSEAAPGVHLDAVAAAVMLNLTELKL